MPALTGPRDTKVREGVGFAAPVAAGETIYQGALVAFDAAGNLVPGSTATTLKAAGRAKATVDNSAGVAGAQTAEYARGCFAFSNFATDLITRADIGNSAYIVDDQTVARTDGTGTRSVAGIIRDIDAVGVWIEI